MNRSQKLREWMRITGRFANSDIEEAGKRIGMLGSTATRVCRKCCEEGLVRRLGKLGTRQMHYEWVGKGDLF